MTKQKPFVFRKVYITVLHCCRLPSLSNTDFFGKVRNLGIILDSDLFIKRHNYHQVLSDRVHRNETRQPSPSLPHRRVTENPCDRTHLVQNRLL